MAKERVILVPSDCGVIINDVVLLLEINILCHTYINVHYFARVYDGS